MKISFELDKQKLKKRYTIVGGILMVLLMVFTVYGIFCNTIENKNRSAVCLALCQADGFPQGIYQDSQCFCFGAEKYVPYPNGKLKPAKW